MYYDELRDALFSHRESKALSEILDRIRDMLLFELRTEITQLEKLLERL